MSDSWAYKLLMFGKLASVRSNQRVCVGSEILSIIKLSPGLPGFEHTFMERSRHMNHAMARAVPSTDTKALDRKDVQLQH